MLVEAVWGFDDDIVLLAFEQRVAALHFVKQAPSFVAHLLPLDLPTTTERTRVENIAWDQARQRLAVSLNEADHLTGAPVRRTALYALQPRPVLSATHLLDVSEPTASSASGWRAKPLFAGSSLIVAWGSHLSSVAVQ